tara:strand:- start:951 stop:2228 length:1278 start_codon:yes stop_codon:yes gene_type:complete
MLSIKSLTPDQQAGVTRLVEYDNTLMVAATGVGKTVMCLTAIKELIEMCHLHKVIVACPAKVVENLVWPNEAAKWKHLRDIRVLQLQGTAQNRLEQLLSCEAEIIVVSLNNLDWLLQQDHGADGIIVDELSKAAGKQAKKLKSKKWGEMLKYRVGMTATPVSQDLIKLQPMCRIIDNGVALGTNKQKFLEKYFYSDYMGYNWTIRDGADVQILKRVASLVHLVKDNKAETLPPLRESLLRFNMPAETREIYDDMKKHMVTDDREAANEAVKSGVLRTIASGFTYRDDHSVVIHDWARHDAMKEWAAALDGRPGLIFYEFVFQGVWNDTAPKPDEEQPHNVTFAQINSMSHGVDGLQHEFADVLFLQPVWSRDAHEQAIGRVWRQGQMKPVNVTTLICNDTLDDLVVARVEDRGEWMKLFKQHLKG